MNLFEAERFAEDAFRVKRTYIDAAGDLNAGILLGQIVYWFMPDRHGRPRARIERDGRTWIAKRRADWFDEIRLTDRQVDRALKILKDKGLVEVAFFKHGTGPMPHISLNESVLTESVKSTLRKALGRPNTNREDNLTQCVSSSTKQRLPTETTTETTTARADDAAVMDAFYQAFGKMPNGLQLEKVSEHLDDGMQPDLLIEIFERSALGGKAYNYADGALVRIKRQGILTLEQFLDNEAKRRHRRNARHEGYEGRTRKDGSASIDHLNESPDFSDVDLEDL